jgi:radical SAM superfamily enzyme YgiQ (UPF0313 family)
MKVALIGPELEENLGLRYLHSSIERKAHKAEIFDFNAAAQIPLLVPRILQYDLDVVGLSMVFTGRAQEFLQLAQALREAGFSGHITAGGHFASFHAQQLLTHFPALSSIVHGEGEDTIVDLIEHLSDLDCVLGISYMHKNADVEKSPPRPNPDDLDTLPFPSRPACFHTYLWLPIANILGSRGCYVNCYYCSITAWYKQNLGKRFRQRSVRNIAREMAQLYHERGVRIFNFHDDNFFLANTRKTVDRFTALQRCLEHERVGRIAIQVKARPDSVHKEPISILKDMGLFRVFLGVESNSTAGLQTLGRGIPKQENHRALKILQDFDIHVSFNLLMFDPETTLSDVRDNIDFMRQYSHIPLNFGRTEVYSGTTLEQMLRTQNRLQGNFLGYSYVISSEQAQTVFEIYRQVFLPRNFDADGMNLQAMRLDYSFHLLKHFYPRRASRSLRTRVKALTRKLNNNSAAMLTEICDYVASSKANDPNTLDHFVKSLAHSRSKFDAQLSLQTHALLDEIRELALCHKPNAKTSNAIAASAAAAVLMITVAGCEGPGKEERPSSEPNEIVTSQPQVRQLSEEEVEAVEAHIQRNYQIPVDFLFGKHNLRNLKVTVDLHIGSKGKVASSNILMSEGQRNEAFEKDLTEQIKQWVFPAVKSQGRCRVILEAHRSWHMCEMMMPPIEPKEQ